MSKPTVASSPLANLERRCYRPLHRLEHQGAIVAEWGISELGRHARFYWLTAARRKQLGAEAESWARLTAAIRPGLEQA